MTQDPDLGAALVNAAMTDAMADWGGPATLYSPDYNGLEIATHAQVTVSWDLYERGIGYSEKARLQETYGPSIDEKMCRGLLLLHDTVTSQRVNQLTQALLDLADRLHVDKAVGRDLDRLCQLSFYPSIPFKTQQKSPVSYQISYDKYSEPKNNSDLIVNVLSARTFACFNKGCPIRKPKPQQETCYTCGEKMRVV